MANEVVIKVNGSELASVTVPARFSKTVLADELPEGGTPQEQAEAFLGWLKRVASLEAESHRHIGSRYYDVLLKAVEAEDSTWNAMRVQRDGLAALETAYDAIP